MEATNHQASDNALMVRYQRGDLAAYAELVQRHLPGVYTLASCQGQDPAVAQELTLDVFAALARRAGEFREQVPFSTWLYRLAVSAPEPAEIHAPKLPVESGAQDAFALMRLLPDAQRTVFLLKQVAGLQFAQIADIIGTDIQEVKQRLRKALLLIQKTAQERRALGEGPRRTSEP